MAAIVFFSLVIIGLLAVVAFGMRSVFFCEFQLPRIARRHSWMYESPPRELTRRELHILWACTGDLPTQELTRVKGAYRGYEFDFLVFEFPTITYDDKGRESLDMKTDSTIELSAHHLPSEFTKWLLKNHGRGPVEMRKGQLKSRLGEYVARRSFIRRLDHMVDIVEDWTNNGDKRRTK